MHPFLRSIAGVFAANGNSLGKPTIAEQICASLVQAISRDSSRCLQPDWWSFCLNQMPHLVLVTQTAAEADSSIPASLARNCISASIAKIVPNSVDALTNLITTLPQPATLNSLVISVAPSKKIDLSMTFFGVSSSNDLTKGERVLPFQRLEFLIDYSNARVAGDIDNIFGSERALGAVPYYARLESVS